MKKSLLLLALGCVAHFATIEPAAMPKESKEKEESIIAPGGPGWKEKEVILVRAGINQISFMGIRYDFEEIYRKGDLECTYRWGEGHKWMCTKVDKDGYHRLDIPVQLTPREVRETFERLKEEYQVQQKKKELEGKK